jgi:hypothetical protein
MWAGDCTGKASPPLPEPLIRTQLVQKGFSVLRKRRAGILLTTGQHRERGVNAGGAAMDVLADSAGECIDDPRCVLLAKITRDYVDNRIGMQRP